MSSSPSANAASFFESSSKFIFPGEEDLRRKIPLWMKFYCYEYSSTAIGRTIAYTRSGGGASIGGITKEKAQIFIPAPVNFQTTTSHNYSNIPSLAVNLLPSIYDVSQIANLFPGGGSVANTFLSKIGELIHNMNVADEAIGQLYGLNSENLQAEPNDTTYTPTGASRAFEIRVNMPCLTERDSMAAGSVIRAFEALSLPTIRSLFGISTKYYNPPLWVFGIGPIDSFKFDPDWTGFPQLSVLKTVTHKKTAFDTNSLSALGHNSLLKPVAYTMSLLFQELEPAFRQTNPIGGVGLNIINRSTAITTTGTTAVARVTGS